MLTFFRLFKKKTSPLEEAKQEIQRLQEEIASLKAEIAKNAHFACLGRQTTGVVHDLHNIMQIIIGYAEIIIDGPSDTKNQQSAEKILEAMQKAISLSDAIMLMAKKQTAPAQIANVHQTINKITKDIKLLIKKDVLLKFNLVCEHASFEIKPLDLYRCLLNLCVNAQESILKTKDTGTITISTATVVVNNEFIAHFPEARTGNFVRISITDDGPGISEALLKQLFKSSFTTSEHGHGIGLSVVEKIVSDNEGFIIVESKIDYGTTVNLFFPEF